MNDFTNQTLAIGDTVAFMTPPKEFGSVFLMKGTVIKFTNTGCQIDCGMAKPIHRQSHRIAKLNLTQN